MSRVFTDEQVIEAIDKAVAEKGVDYIYPGAAISDCKNVEVDYDTGAVTPSCIVGFALCNLGVDPKEFVNAHAEDLTVEGTLPALEVEVGLDIFRALERAQQCQDAGETWGEARAAFIERSQKVAA